MEQFCYTSCRTGASVSVYGGFGVRCLSEGLSEAMARSMLPQVKYELPPGWILWRETRDY
ncbi:MAG: hypothetical protein HQK59_13785 [Deltaproteobacteria bacterium]|nr:hypothetical protein [Deltaproteobacteria bacterium]